MGWLDKLPTMAEVAASWVGRPIEKGASRLDAKIAEKRLILIDDKTFKKTVWARDKSHCRCCLRKVERLLQLVPDRGEVHHVHGRAGDLRFEDRCALLLCAVCHQRVTGRVNDRVIIVPSRTLVIHGERLTDARFPVTFEKVA